MKNKKAFTLLEGLVTLTIISVMVLITIPNLLPLIKSFNVKANLLTLEQAVNETRSLAIKKSGTVYLDFAQATANNGDNGGLLEIKQNDGTLITQIYLEENILYNATGSTIDGNVVRFDFQRQPVDATGDPDGFTTGNNTVSIAFYSGGGNALVSKSLTISPITGKVVPQ